MAKTGKKTFVYEIQQISILEEVIDFAKKKAENSGLRIHIEYKHDIGLMLTVAGPKDKINLIDHILREFVNEITSDYEN